METSILVFLGVALAILTLAVILPRFFAKSDERTRRGYDINADRRDGRGTATWIGINRGSRDDIGGDGGLHD